VCERNDGCLVLNARKLTGWALGYDCNNTKQAVSPISLSGDAIEMNATTGFIEWELPQNAVRKCAFWIIFLA
jgi:hypothetical protein